MLGHTPQLVVGVCIFYLGLFVFVKNPRSMTHVSFFMIAIATAFWLVPYIIAYQADDRTAYGLLKFSYSFILFIPATLYHFCASVLNEKKEARLVYLAYLSVLPFLALLWNSDLVVQYELYRYPWGNYPRAGAAHPYFLLFFVMTQIRINYLVVAKYIFYVKSGDVNARNKVMLVMLGAIIFNFASVDFLPNYGIEIHPLGYIFAGIYATCITLAILTQQLLDFRIVKRTFVYSAVVFIQSCIYVMIIFMIVSSPLRLKVLGGTVAPNFFAITLIVLFFTPLHIFISRRLDKQFFRGTIFEISEQKERLETELERGERLRSVGVLAAGMAHEIKNPITAIQTFAGYLPTKYDDPEFREKFQRIVTQETKRIKEIVSDLLLFSRPQNPVPRECDIAIIIRDVLDLLGSQFLRSKIAVSHNLGAALPRVWVDPEQTKQVFLNIIMNAIDAMKDRGGDLKVGATVYPYALEISIKDTGCGISADKLPYIFDPFYTDKDAGTGLGLSIAHSILTKNKGKISVSSYLNVGTEFKVSLPIESPIIPPR